MLERSGQSAYLMLCSLTDGKGHPLEKPEKLELLSEELQNTIQVFNQEDKVMSMCSVSEDENSTLAMLNDLRKFCTDKELETLDMITNMVSMMETYETIFA